MELKTFIESGIIESYLLGTATMEEIRLVNDMIAKHPELKTEFNAIETALLKTAESNATTPDASVKQKIFLKINAVDEPSNNAISFKPSRSNTLLKYGIAASVAFLIVSLVLNMIFISRGIALQNELVKLNKEKTYMQAEVDNQQRNMSKMEEQFAVITDPNNKKVMLKGMDMAPNSMATVFWNNASKDVYLYINNLPDPPTDKQYQLWAIVDGKPVDAGMFDMGKGETLQKMKSFSDAQAFAVTLENKGGSATPTMEAMYLMGEV